MPNTGNCFQTLGLSVGATQEQIKQAYHDLVKVWHPDRFAHDPRLQKQAEEKLKAINEAYDFLMRPQSQTFRPGPRPAPHATFRILAATPPQRQILDDAFRVIHHASYRHRCCYNGVLYLRKRLRPRSTSRILSGVDVAFFLQQKSPAL